MALPSGYTPMEYIESTGSQYVDTKLVINKTDSYEYILDSLLTNGTFGGANGYLQFEGSISGGKRVTIRVSYDGSTHVTTVYVDGVVFSTTDWTSSYSGENVKIGILRMGNAGDVWYASDPQIGKVYSCQIKKDKNLVRDFLPCTNPSGEVGLYDDVNGVFYGNAGTGTFVAGPVAIYTELEYIESTGTQYVDTGISDLIKLITDVQFTSTGARALMGYGSEAGQYFGINANDFLELGPSVISSVSGTKRNTVTFEVGSSATTLTANGVTISRARTAVIDTSFKILGDLADYPCPGKIFSGEVYVGGTLVRDYIPVQRLDGAVGLLDKVNNVFYPDAAGGNFIAGPLAAQPEAPASLEVVGATRNAVVLAWLGAPVGQSYRLYRDGVVVYEGSNLCYTDVGLAAGSAHVYSIHTLSGSTESDGVTTEATTTEGIVLITDRTASDVSAGRRKGFYNAMDLIRVGEAMVYLEERFDAVGITVSVSPKLDWQFSDIPTHAQALHYLEDLGVLRDKLLEYRQTVSAPDSLTTLTWSKANDIETILLDAEKLIRDIVLSYRHYSGRTISGVNTLP